MVKKRKLGRSLKKLGIQQIIFLAFLAVVVIGSLITLVPLWLAAVLALVIGLVNITVKETQKTLMAALVLLFGSGVLLAFNQVPVIGEYLGSLFNNLAVYLGIVGVFAGIKELVFASRD